MDKKNAKYILPNLFTLASVLFGMVAVISTMAMTPQGYIRASICILLAMVADSFDGRVARMTGTATRFGIQLDSLADALSFGMAPAILAYTFSLKMIGGGSGKLGVFIAFVYVSCGIVRLARFNVSASGKGKKSKYFQGLPIPAGAALIATMVWCLQDMGMGGADKAALVAFMMLVSSFLMVSSVPYRNFKHVKIGLGMRVAMVLVAALVIFATVQTRMSIVIFILAVLYGMLGPVEGLYLAYNRVKSRRNDQEDPDEVDSESH